LKISFFFHFSIFMPSSLFIGDPPCRAARRPSPLHATVFITSVPFRDSPRIIHRGTPPIERPWMGQWRCARCKSVIELGELDRGRSGLNHGDDDVLSLSCPVCESQQSREGAAGGRERRFPMRIIHEGAQPVKQGGEGRWACPSCRSVLQLDSTDQDKALDLSTDPRIGKVARIYCPVCRTERGMAPPPAADAYDKGEPVAIDGSPVIA
jgi:hypothetical protein